MARYESNEPNIKTEVWGLKAPKLSSLLLNRLSEVGRGRKRYSTRIEFIQKPFSGFHLPVYFIQSTA